MLASSPSDVIYPSLPSFIFLIQCKFLHDHRWWSWLSLYHGVAKIYLHFAQTSRTFFKTCSEYLCLCVCVFSVPDPLMCSGGAASWRRLKSSTLCSTTPSATYLAGETVYGYGWLVIKEPVYVSSKSTLPSSSHSLISLVMKSMCPVSQQSPLALIPLSLLL